MIASARRVCVFTSTRAEFGLLLPVIRALQAEKGLAVQVLATGTHLEDHEGRPGTRWEIEGAGIGIDAAVSLAPRSDSRADVARAMGEATPGFVEAFERLRPELLLMLGDRYELLPAAGAATVLGIPIAHLAGGDVTRGAFDDRVRGAISQLASLHFVFHAEAERRVVAAGADPKRVIRSGSPANDEIRSAPPIPRATLERDLEVALGAKNLLVTFHPVTDQPDGGRAELEELLAALGQLATRHGDGLGIWFTAPNADPGGETFRKRITEAVGRWPRAMLFDSLGAQRYRALARLCDAVVGNSSSGIYEAPALGRPALDVGARQWGRARPPEAVTVPANAAAIVAELERRWGQPPGTPSDFFGDGGASVKIARGVREFLGG